MAITNIQQLLNPPKKKKKPAAPPQPDTIQNIQQILNQPPAMPTPVPIPPTPSFSDFVQTVQNASKTPVVKPIKANKISGMQKMLTPDQIGKASLGITNLLRNEYQKKAPKQPLPPKHQYQKPKAPKPSPLRFFRTGNYDQLTIAQGEIDKERRQIQSVLAVPVIPEESAKRLKLRDDILGQASKMLGYQKDNIQNINRLDFEAMEPLIAHKIDPDKAAVERQKLEENKQFADTHLQQLFQANESLKMATGKDADSYNINDLQTPVTQKIRRTLENAKMELARTKLEKQIVDEIRKQGYELKVSDLKKPQYKQIYDQMEKYLNSPDGKMMREIALTGHAPQQKEPWYAPALKPLEVISRFISLPTSVPETVISDALAQLDNLAGVAVSERLKPAVDVISRLTAQGAPDEQIEPFRQILKGEIARQKKIWGKGREIPTLTDVKKPQIAKDVLKVLTLQQPKTATQVLNQVAQFRGDVKPWYTKQYNIPGVSKIFGKINPTGMAIDIGMNPMTYASPSKIVAGAVGSEEAVTGLSDLMKNITTGQLTSRTLRGVGHEVTDEIASTIERNTEQLVKSAIKKHGADIIPEKVFGATGLTPAQVAEKGLNLGSFVKETPLTRLQKFGQTGTGEFLKTNLGVKALRTPEDIASYQVASVLKQIPKSLSTPAKSELKKLEKALGKKQAKELSTRYLGGAPLSKEELAKLSPEAKQYYSAIHRQTKGLIEPAVKAGRLTHGRFPYLQRRFEAGEPGGILQALQNEYRRYTGKEPTGKVLPGGGKETPIGKSRVTQRTRATYGMKRSEDIETLLKEYPETLTRLASEINPKTIDQVMTDVIGNSYKKTLAERTGLTKEEWDALSPADKMKYEKITYNVGNPLSIPEKLGPNRWRFAEPKTTVTAYVKSGTAKVAKQMEAKRYPVSSPGRALRQTTDLFKSYLTVGKPWHYFPVRGVGDISRMYLSPTGFPKAGALKAVHRIERGKPLEGYAMKTPLGDISYQDIKNYMGASNIRRGSALARTENIKARFGHLVNPLSQKNVYLQGMKALESKYTGGMRERFFAQALKKTGNFAEAQALTDKWMFNFMRQTPAESRFAQSAFPFYAYHRENIPLMLSSLYRQTGKYEPLASLYNNLQAQLGETGQTIPPSQIPDYVKAQGGFQMAGKISGQPMFGRVGLPIEDINLLASPFAAGESSNVLQQLAFNMSPALTALPDIAKRIGIGEPAKPDTGYVATTPAVAKLAQMPGIKQLLGLMGAKPPILDKDPVTGQPMWKVNKDTDWLYQRLPYIPDIKRLTKQDSQQLIPGLIRTLGGRIYTANPTKEEINKLWDYNQQLQAVAPENQNLQGLNLKSMKYPYTKVGEGPAESTKKGLRKWNPSEYPNTPEGNAKLMQDWATERGFVYSPNPTVNAQGVNLAAPAKGGGGSGGGYWGSGRRTTGKVKKVKTTKVKLPKVKQLPITTASRISPAPMAGVSNAPIGLQSAQKVAAPSNNLTQLANMLSGAQRAPVTGAGGLPHSMGSTDMGLPPELANSLQQMMANFFAQNGGATPANLAAFRSMLAQQGISSSTVMALTQQIFSSMSGGVPVAG